MPGADRMMRGGIGSQMPYIADFNIVGISAKGVNSATSRTITALEGAGLPTAAAKTQSADTSNSQPAAALGLWWWPEGVLTPRPAMIRRLRKG